MFLEKALVLGIICAACATVQIMLISHGPAEWPAPLWRLPSPDRDQFCIRSMCGTTSLFLIIGGPAIAVCAAIGHDVIRRKFIRRVAATGALRNLDDALLQIQYVFVLILLIANAHLNGAFLSAISGPIDGRAPALIWQMTTVALAFASSTLATLSGFAREARSKR